MSCRCAGAQPNSYEQDQEVFDQVTELAASEEAALGIDEKTNSGGNAGTDPR